MTKVKRRAAAAKTPVAAAAAGALAAKGHAVKIAVGVDIRLGRAFREPEHQIRWSNASPSSGVTPHLPST